MFYDLGLLKEYLFVKIKNSIQFLGNDDPIEENDL